MWNQPNTHVPSFSRTGAGHRRYVSLTTRGLFTVETELIQSNTSGCKRTFKLTPSWNYSSSNIRFCCCENEANVRRRKCVQPLGGMSARARKDVADEIHIPLQTSEKCWAFDQLIGGVQRRHWWLPEEDRELNHSEPPICICNPPRQTWLGLLNILESKSCYASFPPSWISFVPVSRGRLRTALILREDVTSWGWCLRTPALV